MSRIFPDTQNKILQQQQYKNQFSQPQQKQQIKQTNARTSMYLETRINGDLNGIYEWPFGDDYEEPNSQ